MIVSDVRNKATTHAVVINLTNHRIPEHVFDVLKEKYEMRTFSVFSETAHFDFDRDIWPQVEGVAHRLKQNKNQRGEDAFTNEGQRFVFLPSATVPSVLLGMFFYRVFGIGPYIGLVHKNEKGIPHVKQIINTEAFLNKAHNHHRAELVLEKEVNYANSNR